MFQDGAGGAGGGGVVAHVAVAEGTDEHFVNGRDEHFPKGLVGAIVIVEDGGGNLMGVAKVGEVGARRDIWYGGLSGGVDRSDEGRGREWCVHSGGDSEFQQSECAVAQVILDGCGVRVQF